MCKQRKMEKKAAIARQVTARKNAERKQAREEGLSYWDWKWKRSKK